MELQEYSQIQLAQSQNRQAKILRKEIQSIDSKEWPVSETEPVDENEMLLRKQQLEREEIQLRMNMPSVWANRTVFNNQTALHAD